MGSLLWRIQSEWRKGQVKDLELRLASTRGRGDVGFRMVSLARMLECGVLKQGLKPVCLRENALHVARLPLPLCSLFPPNPPLLPSYPSPLLPLFSLLLPHHSSSILPLFSLLIPPLPPRRSLSSPTASVSSRSPNSSKTCLSNSSVPPPCHPRVCPGRQKHSLWSSSPSGRSKRSACVRVHWQRGLGVPRELMARAARAYERIQAL